MNSEKNLLTVGYALCGSFCTLSSSITVLEELVKKYRVIPVFSENMRLIDTRFGNASDITARIEEITNKRAITTIAQAERVGPEKLFDIMVIAPCTGNTLAKLSHGIIDSTVAMTAKAHIRNERPLVIALASNDALSAGLSNIAEMIKRKNVYFVPMRQDDYKNKPNSLVADFTLVEKTVEMALTAKQIEPILLSPLPKE